MVAALAYYSPHGFARTFVLLLALCSGLAAIFAALRREPVFGPTLTYWEESALYAVLCFLWPRCLSSSTSDKIVDRREKLLRLFQRRAMAAAFQLDMAGTRHFR